MIPISQTFHPYIPTFVMCLPPCVPSSDLHFLAVGATLAQIGIGPSAAPPSSASAARLPPLPAVLPPKKLGVAVDAASVPIGAAAAAATATTEQVVAEASAGGGLMAYVVRKTLGEFLVAWTPLVRQAAAAWVQRAPRPRTTTPFARTA